MANYSANELIEMLTKLLNPVEVSTESDSGVNQSINTGGNNPESQTVDYQEPQKESNPSNIVNQNEANGETMGKQSLSTDSGNKEISSNENTELAPKVVAPIITEDKTVITSDDMLSKVFEQRLSTVTHDMGEIKNTLNMLIAELDTVKGHFSVIDNTISSTSVPVTQRKDFETLLLDRR